MEIGIAMKLLKSLQVYVVSQRENFNQFKQKAQDKAPQVPYKDANKRQVHRKRQDNDGPVEECVLTGCDRLPILDKLFQALDLHTAAYKVVSERFRFMTSFQGMTAAMIVRMLQHCNNIVRMIWKKISQKNLNILVSL